MSTELHHRYDGPEDAPVLVLSNCWERWGCGTTQLGLRALRVATTARDGLAGTRATRCELGDLLSC